MQPKVVVASDPCRPIFNTCACIEARYEIPMRSVVARKWQYGTDGKPYDR
jgi:hypothetical protein